MKGKRATKKSAKKKSVRLVTSAIVSTTGGVAVVRGSISGDIRFRFRFNRSIFLIEKATWARVRRAVRVSQSVGTFGPQVLGYCVRPGGEPGWAIRWVTGGTSATDRIEVGCQTFMAIEVDRLIEDMRHMNRLPAEEF